MTDTQVAMAHPDLSDDLDRWKDRTVEWVLRLVVVSFAVTATVTLTLGTRASPLALAIGFGVSLVAALRPRWSRSTRVAFILAGTFIGLASVMSGAGFLAPNMFVAAALVQVYVLLVLDTRAAFFTWLLTIVAFSVGGALFVTGVLPPPSPDALQHGDVRNWLRVGVLYATMTSTMLFMHHLLHVRMQRLAEERANVQRRLLAESEDKLRAVEQKRAAEEQLLQSQKLEALGTMAGGVAHDFNNLLTVILNGVEMMREELPEGSEGAEEMLEMVQGAGERAAGLTRQLLAFSRRQVSERSAIDVNATVDTNLTMLRRLLPSNVVVTFDRHEDAGRVWGSDVELGQVLMNLCVNARDAMPEGGDLAIATQHDDVDGAPYTRLSVRDTGSGMSEAMRARIFEPFFTSKPMGAGTGLGLSVVHGIVSSLKGRIEVDSTEGVGTTFHVWLPTTGASEVVTSERAHDYRGDETILIAEDTPAVLEVMKSQLERIGFRVFSSSDGDQALERLRTQDTIDLLISDAVMPGIDGRALVEAAEELRPDLPVLVCSGYAAERFAPGFFETPHRAFLAKPFTSEALHEAVRRLLDAAKRD